MKIPNWLIVAVLAAVGAYVFYLFDSAKVRSWEARRGDAVLSRGGLQLGDSLPDVSGYDIAGNPFALNDIKGSHSVIVFGCMT